MSNTTKHTPGPWSAHAYEIIGNTGELIATIELTDGMDPGEAFANAWLIVESPELLEAAKDVCGLLFSLDNVPDDHPAYQRLKEAIKKAQP